MPPGTPTSQTSASPAPSGSRRSSRNSRARSPTWHRSAARDPPRSQPPTSTPLPASPTSSSPVSLPSCASTRQRSCTPTCARIHPRLPLTASPAPMRCSHRRSPRTPPPATRAARPSLKPSPMPFPPAPSAQKARPGPEPSAPCDPPRRPPGRARRDLRAPARPADASLHPYRTWRHRQDPPRAAGSRRSGRFLRRRRALGVACPPARPRLCLSAIAQALEISEQPPASLQATLAEALQGKAACLLVLDNAEHLLPAIADDIALLRDIPGGPSLLVTSRERLDLQAERLYPVPSLQDSEAAELFSDRASYLDPAHDPSTQRSRLSASASINSRSPSSSRLRDQTSTPPPSS